MNILALADMEAEALWDVLKPEAHKTDVDLVLSCGDLDPDYLSFIATYTKAPVLYVHGNHDGCYKHHPPTGCVCVEDRIYNCNGLRILGLGGSIRYSRGPHQYTQKEMERRIRRLKFALWKNGGFDILLTHSAAFGLGDGGDRAHEGFKPFLNLLDTYRPRAMVHGHTHLNYNYDSKRVLQIHDTKIINAYEKYSFSLDAKETIIKPL